MQVTLQPCGRKFISLRVADIAIMHTLEAIDGAEATIIVLVNSSGFA